MQVMSDDNRRVFLNQMLGVEVYGDNIVDCTITEVSAAKTNNLLL